MNRIKFWWSAWRIRKHKERELVLKKRMADYHSNLEYRMNKAFHISKVSGTGVQYVIFNIPDDETSNKRLVVATDTDNSLLLLLGRLYHSLNECSIKDAVEAFNTQNRAFLVPRPRRMVATPDISTYTTRQRVYG